LKKMISATTGTVQAALSSSTSTVKSRRGILERDRQNTAYQCATQHVELSATCMNPHSAHRRHGERRVVRGVAVAPASRARAASNGGAGPGTDGDSPLPVVTPGSGAARCPEQCTARCKHLQTATYAWSETPGASGGGAAGTGLASHRVVRGARRR